MYLYTDVSCTFHLLRLYTAFTQEIDSTYYYAGQRHDFWELVVALDGEIGVTAGEQTGILKKGQAILHTPMEFHRVWYAGTGPSHILIITFAAEYIPQLSTRQFFIPDLNSPRKLVEHIRTAYQVDQSDGITILGKCQPELTCQILVKQVELFLLELFQSTSQNLLATQSRSTENYAKIVRCLESHVCENLSVDDIARLCNMSTANAKLVFAQYAGTGIHSYFNHLKIERAIPLLRGGMSVQETATTLGFSSPNYFSTMFKRITGLTPTACRTHCNTLQHFDPSELTSPL